MSTANTTPRDLFHLDQTYIHLADGGAATPLDVGPDFWAQIHTCTDVSDGLLMCLFHFTEDWPDAEMHPAGDEIVYLLSGSIDVVLEADAGERLIQLRNRAACIVPRGMWHRAVVHEPSDVLHITPGAGTEHRPS